jgi:hypothetical protein
MKIIAIKAGQPPFPDEGQFCRARGYGFRCSEPCGMPYWLYVPKELPFGFAEGCQRIAKKVCRGEHHPNHPRQFEISLT